MLTMRYRVDEAALGAIVGRGVSTDWMARFTQAATSCRRQARSRTASRNDGSLESQSRVAIARIGTSRCQIASVRSVVKLCGKSDLHAVMAVVRETSTRSLART